MKFERLPAEGLPVTVTVKDHRFENVELYGAPWAIGGPWSERRQRWANTARTELANGTYEGEVVYGPPDLKPQKRLRTLIGVDKEIYIMEFAEPCY